MERHGPRAHPESDEDALRRKLIRRSVLAAILVAALLGGLALIDRYYMRPPATPGTAQLAADLKPLALTPPPVPSPQSESVPAQAEPEESAGPSIDKNAERPKPISGAPLPFSAAKPTPAMPPAPGHAPTPHLLSREPRQLVWQLGVFENIANAEKLHDKLKAAGIPNRIEARVQAGPFKNRQEAEAARAKLIEMGLSPSLLIPVQK